jgi:hypothetical protein
MFWSKNAKPSGEGMEVAEQCQMEAEALYRSGTHHCAEAVMELSESTLPQKCRSLWSELFSVLAAVPVPAAYVGRCPAVPWRWGWYWKIRRVPRI